jgi:hypothetical protein
LIQVKTLSKKLVDSHGVKIAATIIIIASVTIASGPALSYTEHDVLLKIQFCETATRLPWGDANQYAWDDCVRLRGKLRSEEEYLKNFGHSDPEWRAALQASSLWARQEGCERWPETQP